MVNNLSGYSQHLAGFPCSVLVLAAFLHTFHFKFIHFVRHCTCKVPGQLDDHTHNDLNHKCQKMKWWFKSFTKYEVMRTSKTTIFDLAKLSRLLFCLCTCGSIQVSLIKSKQI